LPTFILPIRIVLCLVPTSIKNPTKWKSAYKFSFMKIFSCHFCMEIFSWLPFWLRYQASRKKTTNLKIPRPELKWWFKSIYFICILPPGVSGILNPTRAVSLIGWAISVCNTKWTPVLKPYAQIFHRNLRIFFLWDEVPKSTKAFIKIRLNVNWIGFYFSITIKIAENYATFSMHHA